MTNYESYDELPAVAQSCRQFRSGGAVDGSYYRTREGITCDTCGNWNGSRCMKNNYENIINRLES